MFELRPYQRVAVDNALEYLNGRSRRPGVVVLPTAGGKSLIISNIAKELDKPFIVLQPSKEILEQNVEKMESYGIHPTIYSASCGKKELSDMTFAMLKSVKKEVDKLKEIGIGYILIDECHQGYSPNQGSEFMSFIEEFSDVKVLGFTATPCRLHSYGSLIDGNYSKLNMLTKDDPRYFREIVHVTQIKEMVEEKFWTPIEYERWSFDDSNLKLNSTGAEYTNESIQESIVKSGLNNSIYLRILELMKEKKHILVCMDSVESCCIISKFMNNKFGYITDVVSSGTPKKKRTEIIKAFKSGKLKIVFNFASLSTGFDFPELDCLVIGRPTFSYSVWYQAVGRVVRIHPGKKRALVVDCCDNYKRFGAVESMSIEYVNKYGWCMFAGDKVLTGVRLGVTVTRDMLHERINGKKVDTELDKLKREIMPFGKYEGRSFGSIPYAYIDYIMNNFDIMKGSNPKYPKLKRYHELIKLY